MVAGRKTGGRRPGSKNKPKDPTSVDTTASTPVAAAGAAAPPSDPQLPPRARGSRETGLNGGFPPHRTELVGKLIPFEGNARTHPPASIDKLAKLITAFGWTNPILVAGRNIIAGHARRLAAMKLGMERVPVIDLKHLSELDREAVILSDNRSALDGGWDETLLSEAMERLSDGGYDTALTAFDDGEVKRLLGDSESGNTDPDAVPPVPAVPVSLLGDVWVMGRHRLVCGDCTDAAVVKTALVGDAVAAMLVTSPPYWAKQDYDDMPGIDGAAAFCSRVAEAWSGRVRRRIVVNTGTTTENAIDPKGRAGVRIMLDSLWSAAFAAAGWSLRNRRAWVKAGPNPNVAPLVDAVDQSWETLLTFWRVGKNEGGQERVSEAWSTSGYFDGISGVGKNVVGDDHPCPFPVEIPSRFIQIYSKTDDVIAEPFSGSGTTIIAAEMTGRACHAIELAPAYVDVAVKRWQAFTGAEATLESTGQTFAETEASRTAPAKPIAAAKPRTRVTAGRQSVPQAAE